MLYVIFFICSCRFDMIPFALKCSDLAIQIWWFDYVVSVFSFKLVGNISTFLHFSHFPDSQSRKIRIFMGVETPVISESFELS